MQHSIEEMSTWSVNDVLTNVRMSLPDGWSLDVKHNDRSKVFSCIVRDDKDAQAWTEEHSDLRLMLFDLYGWLVVRLAPAVSPMWNRPRQAMPKIVEGEISLDGASSAPDPEDLDPDVIRRLYDR